MKVSAVGRGVVSHAGMGLLRELVDLTGLSAQVTAVLADTYKGSWVYRTPDLVAASGGWFCAVICGFPGVSLRGVLPPILNN